VTVELREAGDYASLKERLRTLTAAQVLANQWALRTTATSAELRDLLKGFVGRNDSVVVTEVGAERASRHAPGQLGGAMTSDHEWRRLPRSVFLRYGDQPAKWRNCSFS